MLEQEIKLAFTDVEAARRAVHTAGGRLVVPRRLLEDRLYDSAEAALRASGRALRLRREPQRAFLTFKGPVQPGPVKSREELETAIGDASIVERIFAHLGFHETFKAQKYREEYELGAAHLAIDEAPVGVFIEIEAAPDEIARVAALLGKTRRDYCRDSYATLWRRHCNAMGVEPTDMLFGHADHPAP